MPAKRGRKRVRRRARRATTPTAEEQVTRQASSGNRQHDRVLQLQQTVGNQATQELVAQGQIDNWQQSQFQGLPPVRGAAGDGIIMTAPQQIMRFSLPPELVGADGLTLTNQRGKEVSAGEEGFSSAMLEDQSLMVEANIGRFKDWHLSPQVPNQRELDEAQALFARWAAEAKQDKEDSGDFLGIAPVSPFAHKQYAEREAGSRKALAKVEAQRTAEQQLFMEYNAWTTQANGIFPSIAKFDGMRVALGIGEDVMDMEALTDELVAGLDDIERIDPKELVGLKIPEMSGQVTEQSLKVDNALSEMETAWLGLRQVDLEADIKALAEKRGTYDAQKEEIEKIIATWKKIGKTVDMSIGAMGGAKSLMGAGLDVETGDNPAMGILKEQAKGIAGSVGIPTDAEGLVGGTVAMMYHNKLRKIQRSIDAFNAVIEGKRGLVAELSLMQKFKDFEDKKKQFEDEVKLLKLYMQNRQAQYVKFGEELDKITSESRKERREGRAPAKGQERYATVMALVAVIREIMTIGRKARDTFPGGDPDGLYKRAVEVTEFEPPSQPDTRAPFHNMLQQSKKYHTLATNIDNIFEGVDAKAFKVMALLNKANVGEEVKKRDEGDMSIADY